jgi:hypothetical protein
VEIEGVPFGRRKRESKVGQAKIPVIISWLVCLSSFLVASDSVFGKYGQIAFWCLVVVHAAECVFYLPLFRRAGGSLGGHLFKAFIFGYFHFVEVRDGLRQEQTAGD